MHARGRLRDTVTTVLPYAALAGAVVGDLAAGDEIVLLPLCSVGPALASANRSLRRVLLSGVVALLVCFAMAAANGLAFQARGMVAYVAVAAVTAAAAYAAAMRTRSDQERQNAERELAEVRMVADVAQQVILRPVPTRIGGLDLAFSYTSAAATATIGGDLYEACRSRAGCARWWGTSRARGWTECAARPPSWARSARPRRRPRARWSRSARGSNGRWSAGATARSSSPPSWSSAATTARSPC